MDIVRILKTVEAFNNHIKNTFVSNGSMMPLQLQAIAKLINVGKMIFDASNFIERPDIHWKKALLELQKIKEIKGNEILNIVFSELQKETKPAKFTHFKSQWEIWSGKDQTTELPDIITASNTTKNLIKLANEIRANKLRSLINAHRDHILKLIKQENIEGAKNYIDAIRPQGWEQSKERNVDIIFQLLVKDLAQSLPPQTYQEIGL